MKIKSLKMYVAAVNDRQHLLHTNYSVFRAVSKLKAGHAALDF